MKRLQSAITFIAIIAATSATGQIKPINKSISSRLLLQKQTAFLFKGKPVAVKPAGKNVVTPSDRKTVQGNITREVVPFDGQVNAETTGNQTREGDGCTTTPVSLTAGFNELNIIDPSGISFWPGRIIDIASVDNGSYSDFRISAPRNTIEIALISAGTSHGKITDTISGRNISQGIVKEAEDKIKNNFGSNEFGSIGWDFETIQTFTQEQFFVEAGAALNVAPIQLSVSASGGTSSFNRKNTLIFKFVRKAYDLKVNSDLAEIVNTQTIPNNAGIISNVSYGQFGLVEIQSDSSHADMEAAFNFTVNPNPSATISAALKTKYQNIVTSLSIKGLFRGVQGNARDLNITSVSQVKNILVGTEKITATTPVVPIAFVINSLSTGDIMMLKSTLSYNRKICPPVLPEVGNTKLKIKLVALTVPSVNDGASNDEDLFGKISITQSGKPGESKLWSKGKSENVKVKNSTVPSDPGAYSMSGVSTDYIVECENQQAKQRAKTITLKAELVDEEFIGGDRKYDTRKLNINFEDLLKSTSTNTNTNIDNFDPTANAFYLDVTEIGNSNKVRVWFKVQIIQ